MSDLYGLHSRDGSTKSLSLLGVGYRTFQGSLCNTQCLSSNSNATSIQSFLQDCFASPIIECFVTIILD